jgi:hypothetical protein
MSAETFHGTAWLCYIQRCDFESHSLRFTPFNNSGTEFKEFIKWGEAKGMTFEITPLYIAEPSGTDI